ncbi:AAA family ATPase [bacterium]|nr:AAA family ATPase [bacterium]
MSFKTQIQSFGPINMQAVEELKNVKEKFDDLNKNIQDVVQAENDLHAVITSLDKEVIKIFKNKIFEINQTLPKIFSKLFKSGNCQIQFTNPDDLLNTGIDVVIKPVGKQIKKLSVLSGGEKSIISLSVLLTILRTSNFPLVVLDEAESALDPKNTELLAKLIKESSDLAQFIMITHRKETMVECDKLIGASMQKHGITSMFNVNLTNIKTNEE